MCSSDLAAPEGGHETPVAPPVAPSPDVPAAPADAPVAPAPVSTLANASISTPEAKVGVVATTAAFVVTFEPAEGHHLYPLGSEDGVPVSVEGKPSAGVTWGKASAPPLGAPDIHEAYTVTIPYTDASAGKAALAVAVSWQACLDTGICRQPEAPHRFELRRATDGKLSLEETMDGVPAAPAVVVAPPVAADGAGPGAPGAPAVRSAIPASGLLFPVTGVAELSSVEKIWKSQGLFLLVWLYLAGLALAFTPCVLPIIPITVSIVGGGKADVTKGRLTFLLCCYVAGLCIAFGSLGLSAALAGASFAGAFQSPVALWIIAGIFATLAFGMFGVYELQPPAWAQRLQGGAKGGNPIGAFLFGCLSAVIASPCTGPAIAGLIVLVAQLANPVLGFIMFVCLGLGMGTVFFAAGSLNMLAKPGPWMVWVRYAFGVLLVGAALYYLRSAGKIGPATLLAMGAGLAVAGAIGIAHHLVTKEGEEAPVARRRGAVVGGLTVAITAIVAVLTGGFAAKAEAVAAGPTVAASGGADTDDTWLKVKSREALYAAVQDAIRDGRPTVVDFWAEWCHYCNVYDKIIDRTPEILAGMRRFRRVKVDLTDADRTWEPGVRSAVGARDNVQPFMVFIDRSGTIHRDLDLQWAEKESGNELLRRVNKLLGGTTAEQAHD